MKILTIVTFLASSFFAQAQYDPDALAVLNAMSAKYKQIGAYSAKFTQELSNESAGISEELSGEITVKDEMYVLKMAGQEIYNNGTDVFNYSPDIKEVTIATFEPEDQEITLSNIYDLYKDGYKYNLMSVNQAGDRIVELDPESKDKSYYKIRMVIDKNDDLKRFTVFERSGNKYQYTIENFEKENNLSEDFFTFNPDDYPKVEVVDFR